MTGFHVVKFVAAEIDYESASTGRTTPLDREARVSNSFEQMESVYEGMKEEYIKKGGKPVDEAE